MLEEALFYRDEFLSIASHELKTPLTALKLQSQIFKRAVAKGDPEAYSKERIDRLMSEADRQVDRLVRLVDDMLDISRLRTGGISINKEPVQLHDLVKYCISRHLQQFYTGDSEILRRCDEVTISCDRQRMEQVISNLLNNAYRYGRGRPFHVEVEKRDGVARISVSDEGIGIAPEDREKIFERFKRSVPAREISGLGLGLYIARQVVESHEGCIWVESELGKGSTFIVELPLEGK